MEEGEKSESGDQSPFADRRFQMRTETRRAAALRAGSVAGPLGSKSSASLVFTDILILFLLG